MDCSTLELHRDTRCGNRMRFGCHRSLHPNSKLDARDSETAESVPLPQNSRGSPAASRVWLQRLLLRVLLVFEGSGGDKIRAEKH
ncbi:hypothetical protein H6P81_005413 [Aristolochia fimbriata]|uniref:Uncharacterized protein n=1 Tax=Aristolochia fimbriata TaxID=158543 RepID=A0AAV7EVJ3_ARIFI|nr:hypothetical protein H6P81_005413 [Aristolochia fimbriata]